MCISLSLLLFFGELLEMGVGPGWMGSEWDLYRGTIVSFGAHRVAYVAG